MPACAQQSPPAHSRGNRATCRIRRRRCLPAPTLAGFRDKTRPNRQVPFHAKRIRRTRERDGARLDGGRRLQQRRGNGGTGGTPVAAAPGARVEARRGRRRRRRRRKRGHDPERQHGGQRADGAEVTQLCNDTYAYFGSAIPKATTCKWKGLSYAASSSAPSQSVLQQNCTSKETACQPTDPWADNLGCNDIPVDLHGDGRGSTPPASATRSRPSSRPSTGSPACATLTSAGTAAIVDAQTANPPASCASLMNTCPDLYPPGPFNQ